MTSATRPHSAPKKPPPQNKTKTNRAPKPGETATIKRYSAFRTVAQQLDLDPATLATVIGMTERTLQRRAKSGQLDEAETLKTNMVEATLNFARTVFGDDVQAREWMVSTLPALGFQRPLDVITTLQGYERVRAILGRLAAGTY